MGATTGWTLRTPLAPPMLHLKLMSEVSCYRMERMLKCTRMNGEELKLGAVTPLYSHIFPWVGTMFYCFLKAGFLIDFDIICHQSILQVRNHEVFVRWILQRGLDYKWKKDKFLEGKSLYTIYSENKFGQANTLVLSVNQTILSINLHILTSNFHPFSDKPSVPRNLAVAGVEHDNVTLSWDTPSSNGGSPITGYVIEKRDAARTNWMGTGTCGADRTEYNATRLFEGTEYFFRVAAENVVGLSDFAELDKPVIPKLPYSKW